MTTDHIDAFLPFTLKKEQNVYNDNGNNISSDNVNDFSSVSLPTLSINDYIIDDESNNEFLRLTPMVRAVYLTYLVKCLLNNYTTYYNRNDNNIPSVQVKKCADQMELHAVQLALEANLYRQNMLRMIADVRSHTVEKKIYKQLVMFLEKPKDRIDCAVQTDDTWMDLAEMYRINVQNVSITSVIDCEKPLQVALPVTNSNSFCKSESVTKDSNNEIDILQSRYVAKDESNSASQEIEIQDEIDSHIMDNISVRNDENSQDSLLQHMQDMFCESDDSSDITRLIEKHSGVTKANIDKEINKMCSEADTIATSNLFHVPLDSNVSKLNVAKVNTNEGRLSFNRYKEIQSKKSIKPKKINVTEAVEIKSKQKISAIWFVERVHQVSKLKAKMTELSLTNYQRHRRIKKKFLILFGEFEEEEMMPDSPICIEEHLSACKERIAPWIVKYLMPFYKKKIKDRQLFKAVAKYIADMLILENTFPEQECVNKYIEDYFKNKKFIKTKQDIYL
ncbi:uncharacterized protein LOC105828837 [Monomorium pharaonis]|uniref:uncharacterized protein LOC105828837 n=1 Tax=Monomorium pharaonis TaxID=307658 RepID=UPI00063F57B1|nr:uncharacterized protein LOC105828837 [Monomorium pharaonis]